MHPTNLARLVCGIPSCRASRSGADGPLPPAPPGKSCSLSSGDGLCELQVHSIGWHPRCQTRSNTPMKQPTGRPAIVCLPLSTPSSSFSPDTSLNRDKPGRGEPLLHHPSTPPRPPQPTPYHLLVDHNHGTPLPASRSFSHLMVQISSLRASTVGAHPRQDYSLSRYRCIPGTMFKETTP